MTTPVLVEVADLREHLKLPATGSDTADLQRKVDAATQLVCDYIADRNPADTDWIAEIEAWTFDGTPDVEPPPVVVLAILEQAASFYRFRGDDETAPQERGYLAPGVENLLSKYKNRAFA